MPEDDVSTKPATSHSPARRQVKQVIVMRRDLQVRRGKEIAQGAHAAMMWLSKKIVDNDRSFTPAEQTWLLGTFTKIVLQVPGLEDLQRLHDDAISAGLRAHLVTDAGLTEFHGVPTVTCLAIGPDYADKIDPVTGDLRKY